MRCFLKGVQQPEKSGKPGKVKEIESAQNSEKSENLEETMQVREKSGSFLKMSNCRPSVQHFDSSSGC